VLGTTQSFSPPAQRNFWALKLDAFGLVQWQSVYGGASSEYGQSVSPTADGGYILAGISDSFTPILEAWIVKVDAAGTIEWQNTYGDLGFESGASQVIERSGGGFAFGGQREHPTTADFDAWVLDLDLTGGVDASCTQVVPSSGISNGTVAASPPAVYVWAVNPPAPVAAVSTVVDTTATEETQCLSPCAPLTP
jgi:hypothetical protein